MIDLPKRDFIHEKLRGLQEWTTGRRNISVSDFLEDAFKELRIVHRELVQIEDQKNCTGFAFEVRKNRVEIAAQYIQAASDLVSSWHKDKSILGGWMHVIPNKTFKTFKGEVSLPELKVALTNLNAEMKKFQNEITPCWTLSEVEYAHSKININKNAKEARSRHAAMLSILIDKVDQVQKIVRPEKKK